VVSAGVRVSKTEYWDQLPSLSSESKREAATARFCAVASSLIFRRDTLFCLYNEVSYPDPTHSRAMPAYTVRKECDERNGKYRENEAGEDRDPLQHPKIGILHHPRRATLGARARYAKVHAPVNWLAYPPGVWDYKQSIGGFQPRQSWPKIPHRLK
jgi:hypothetical protein